MPRPIQSITLSFGLVNVPVRMYTAAKSKAVSFHWLSPEGNRVKQRLYSAGEGQEAPAEEASDREITSELGRGNATPIQPPFDHEVSRDTLLKGFEVARDHYVALTADELKALEETANRHAEIQEFVPLESIDPVFFEKTYYLGPDKGSEKVYRLLAQAMQQNGSGAIAKIVMRGKEKMVLVRANEKGALLLEMLYWGDEVRDIVDLNLPDLALKETEVQLAEKLVQSLSSKKWEPHKYHDMYRERVLELIRKKQEGEEIVAPKPAPAGEVLDLMDALKRSLRDSQSQRKEPARPRSKAHVQRQHRRRKAS